MAHRKRLTAAVWTGSILCVAVAGSVATIAVLVAQSYDPSQLIVEQTIEPWTDAAIACAGCAVIILWSAASLRLWHSVRFPAAGLLLTLGEVCCVAWACVWLYNDYL